jgi:hypothetical protein
MGVDKEKVSVSAIRRLKIQRRGQNGGADTLEVQHVHRGNPTPGNPGGESWVLTVRDWEYKSRGTFVLQQAEAILLADILTETQAESADTWDAPS